MIAYFFAVLALVALLAPAPSQAYAIQSRPKPLIAAPGYRIPMERNRPVIVSQMVRKPAAKRQQVIDHRGSEKAQDDRAHTEEHGHSHNHDSVGVRQILGSFLPFF